MNVKGENMWKRNMKGVGKPLSYPNSIDEELLSWVLFMKDLHFPVPCPCLEEIFNLTILGNIAFDLQRNT